MCKFHLMGSCQRGTQCRFAHDQCELQTLPDLARTKVCKQLLQTGHCEDPHCTYAHSLEEFRVVPGFSAAEKEEADMQRAQLEQLEQMKRTGRPMDPKAQPNMLCGTPVIFVPSLQSMVPPTGDFSPFLPSSPANEKPSVMKEPPGHPGAYGAPLRLQNPQSRFFEHGAAAYMNQGGPSNGYSHPSGLDMRFPEARGFADAMPEASKAVGPRDSRGKVSGNRLRVDDDNETFNPSEPAQIKLGSLRSMSSNSLPVQVDDDDDLQDRGIPGIGMGMQMHGMGMASMPGMHGMPGMPMGMTGPSQALKVKNTFLDYEADCTPLGNRLRPVLSAAGRLDALADEEEPLASLAPGSSLSISNQGRSDLPGVRGLSPLHDPLQRRSDLSSDTFGGVYVKNTFIECEEQQPMATLRAVHTAAGRLDTMWDEDDRGD